MQRPVRSDSAEDMAMTQFPMDPIAKLGLLKMDFLGLTNLTILEQARQMVARRRGITLDFQEIPLDDEKTFSLLSSGETTGVFQLESAGMRRYVKKLKPTSLGDVAAMIALYRPGPMEHIDTFIDAKHGRVDISYPHPMLKDILEETYGVIVYQDQVLLIAQAFAGYTLGEADVVRKAMGKKNPEIMREERKKFVEGALGKGFSQELADEVFQLVEPFAGYAFNKAHSVSYAVIAYWTAYFKANYPEEYMTALLNAHAGQAEKVAGAVTECLATWHTRTPAGREPQRGGLLHRRQPPGQAVHKVRAGHGQERGGLGGRASGGRAKEGRPLHLRGGPVPSGRYARREPAGA